MNDIKNPVDHDRQDFLSMGYKKDIFGSFAYDFELLQKMKSVQARMKSAMQMKSSATP